MNIRIQKGLFFLVTVISMLSLSANVIAAGYDSADIKKGAQLYDKWMAVNKKKTGGNHPLYPASGKKSGGSTWRCKECHGWDYIGKDGRYKKGSHFTGIKGLMDSKGKAADALFKSMTSGNHDFSKNLAKGEIWSVVKFIKEGMVDAGASMGSGDVAKGKTHYDKNCGTCHGADGNKLDVKKKKDGIQGVGWLANDNPQESLHKYRWGHPGTDMPSGLIDQKLSEKDIADILSYSMTLK